MRTRGIARPGRGNKSSDRLALVDALSEMNTVAVIGLVIYYESTDAEASDQSYRFSKGSSQAHRRVSWWMSELLDFVFVVSYQAELFLVSRWLL